LKTNEEIVRTECKLWIIKRECKKGKTIIVYTTAQCRNDMGNWVFWGVDGYRQNILASENVWVQHATAAAYIHSVKTE
jgi:hypothetical protein